MSSKPRSKKIKGKRGKALSTNAKLQPASYQSGQIFNEFGKDVTPLPLNNINSERAQAWTRMGDWNQMCRLVKRKEKDKLSMISLDLGAISMEEITREKVTAERLKPEDKVTIILTETDTIWLFSLESLVVSVESEEAEQLKHSNENYNELLRTRIGNDRYVERGMQTFNELPKIKSFQTDPVIMKDAEAECSNWDMWEIFQNLDVARPKKSLDTSSDVSSVPFEKKEMPQVTFQEAVYLRMIWLNPETIKFERVNIPYPGVKIDSLEIKISEKVLSDQKFKDSLFFMERVLNMNTYQTKHALYRSLPVYKEFEEKSITSRSSKKSSMISISSQRSNISKPILLPLVIGPYLKDLWKFSFPLTEEINVSSIAWNKANPELFAVGHGQFEYRGQKGGLICCWSLKNTEYPERIYTNEYGIMTLAFSKNAPSLLCAGLYNGNIVIYNVKSKKDKPLLDSSETEIIQKGPIFQVLWVRKSGGKTADEHESIVSVGMDGQVLIWILRKGLECSGLMKLRRIPHPLIPSQRERREDALLSKYAAGYCLEFHPLDSNTYLVGTEEGHIHRCSRSYTEQYLTTYMAHTAPVYKIAWSPFMPEMFLTCSADWSIRLWHEDQTSPVLTFFCYAKPVFDISWSPGSSTVFACVNESSIEIWDLAVSCLDPVYTHNFSAGIIPTTISFANNHKRIIVGTSCGDVEIFLLKNMLDPHTDQEQALKKVISIISMDTQNDDKEESNSIKSNKS